MKDNLYKLLKENGIELEETFDIEANGNLNQVIYEFEVKQMSRAMGYTFTAKANYPLGMVPSEDLSLDAHEGEKLQIIGYAQETNQFKLLNTSLEAPEAWFIISPEDLDILAGRKG